MQNSKHIFYIPSIFFIFECTSKFKDNKLFIADVTIENLKPCNNPFHSEPKIFLSDDFCSFDINTMDQDQDCLDEKIAKVLPDIAKLSVLTKETPAYKKESKTLKGFTVIPSSNKNTKPITKKNSVSSKTTCCCMNLTLEEFLLSLSNFTEFSCYC